MHALDTQHAGMVCLNPSDLLPSLTHSFFLDPFFCLMDLLRTAERPPKTLIPAQKALPEVVPLTPEADAKNLPPGPSPIPLA